MKVSIIIPVYNVEPYLHRCLEKVVNQTLSDIEIICVDDGSTDNSGLILDAYASKDPRFKVIHQQNQRQGVARNNAMQVAQGEYIGFVDPDDTIPLNYFEKLYNAAQQHNADIACCNFFELRPSEVHKQVFFTHSKVTDNAPEKFTLACAPPHFYAVNKIYRRNSLMEHGILFKGKVECCEDVYFTIKALYYLPTMVTVPEVTYSYYIINTSTMHTMTPKKQLEKYRSFKFYYKFAIRHGLPIPDKFRRLKRRSFMLGKACLLKIRDHEGILVYWLFDFIPIYWSSIRRI